MLAMSQLGAGYLKVVGMNLIAGNSMFTADAPAQPTVAQPREMEKSGFFDNLGAAGQAGGLIGMFRGIGEKAGEAWGTQKYGSGLDASGAVTGRPFNENTLPGQVLSGAATGAETLGVMAENAKPQVLNAAEYLTGKDFNKQGGVINPQAPSAPTQTPAATQGQAPTTSPADVWSSGAALGIHGAEGSPQRNFAEFMAGGGQMTPEQLAQAGTLAESMGTTFNPETGYSREPFQDAQGQAPQAPQAPIDRGAAIAAGEQRMQGYRDGGGLSPTAQQAIQPPSIQMGDGTQLPSTVQASQAPINAPMGVEATQNALQARFGAPTVSGNMNPPTGGLETDPQGRMIPGGFATRAEAYPGYEQQAASREARLDQRADFGTAVSDRDRRMANGEPTSTADLKDMAAANQRGASPSDVARGQQVANALGVDLKTGQPLRSGSVSDKERAETAKIRAETADILSQIGDKGTELNLSPAELARDKAAGGTLNKWDDSGRATIQSNIGALEEVIGGLESGQIKTRGWVDALPFAGDWARAIVNPTGQDAKDRVQGVIFQTLRETLGAQFTEKEGQRLVEASYNVKLSPEQNAARLRDYTNGLKRAAEARESQMRYLKENKTLSGYEGPTPSSVMSQVGVAGVNGSPIKGDVNYQSDVQSAAADILSNQ